jgi:hypothetical protein
MTSDMTAEMASDAPVDGNALGGPMMDLFGREMTHARTCCARCGDVNPMAAFLVFDRAPAAVVRCPSCGTVTMVASKRRNAVRFYLSAVRWVDVPEG